MRKHIGVALVLAPLALGIGACKLTVNEKPTDKQTGAAATPRAAAIASAAPAAAMPASVDAMASQDKAPNAGAAADIPRPIMQAQVVLDRFGFTPGVVDGKDGLSTRNAVSGFQEANGLLVTGKLDDATNKLLAQWATIPATRRVTIPADFAAGPYADIPKDPEEQAKLPCLCYTSLDEKLAERFHTTVATLTALNPVVASPAVDANVAATAAAPVPASTDGAASPPSVFHAGQTLLVPNVGGDAPGAGAGTDAGWGKTLAMLGVGSEQPSAARIVVSKSKGTLKAYDDAGKLIAVYTATMGSVHDPLPLGQWKILGVAHNPNFHYNPKLFWDASDAKPKALLPPGPNNPVGVVWIDLNIPHYGIHGTPHPETIGRAESHGCVRLTNWDAARLAQMVSKRTAVSFEA